VRRSVTLVAAAAAVFIVAFTACAGGRAMTADSGTQHRTLVVNDDPTPICVAVASSVAEQVVGLSKRQTLPPKEGMAFPFATATQENFTMQDTSFPLAIVWVGPSGQVLGSTPMSALARDPYPSPAPITLAVELSPQDWNPLAGTARTVSLGEACEGTVVAGSPGKPPQQF
jgi:uncharacterized membrane protein (UPF0127 family)